MCTHIREQPSPRGLLLCTSASEIAFQRPDSHNLQIFASNYVNAIAAIGAVGPHLEHELYVTLCICRQIVIAIRVPKRDGLFLKQVLEAEKPNNLLLAIGSVNHVK